MAEVTQIAYSEMFFFPAKSIKCSLLYLLVKFSTILVLLIGIAYLRIFYQNISDICAWTTSSWCVSRCMCHLLVTDITTCNLKHLIFINFFSCSPVSNVKSVCDTVNTQSSKDQCDSEKLCSVSPRGGLNLMNRPLIQYFQEFNTE